MLTVAGHNSAFQERVNQLRADVQQFMSKIRFEQGRYEGTVQKYVASLLAVRDELDLEMERHVNGSFLGTKTGGTGCADLAFLLPSGDRLGFGEVKRYGN